MQGASDKNRFKDGLDSHLQAIGHFCLDFPNEASSGDDDDAGTLGFASSFHNQVPYLAENAHRTLHTVTRSFLHCWRYSKT